MDLHEFRALPIRFRWGGAGGEDCLTLLGRRTETRFGVDPCEEFRGTYSDEDGARAVLKRHGGAVALVGRLAMANGFHQVADGFQDDDVAIVRAPSALGGIAEVGAIRFGPLWLVLHPKGLLGKALPHVAVWRRTT